MNEVFYIDNNGRKGTLGKITEVSLYEETPEKADIFELWNDSEFTFSSYILWTKKSKKIFAKMIGLQKWSITQLLNPRKKKRGAMRRFRRIRNERLNKQGSVVQVCAEYQNKNSYSE